MKHAVRIFVYCYGEEELLENYRKALTASGMEAVIARDIRLCADCHGLLLPGGCDSDPRLYGQENVACGKIDLNRDLKELELVQKFVSEHKPVLGICRGHQLLNIAFGGDLIQDLERKHLHVQIQGEDQIHTTTIAAGSMLEKLYGSSAMVNSAHHQAIGQLAKGFRAVQWSQDGVIEAMEHESLPILSTQWHPERLTCEKKRREAVDGARIFEWLQQTCERLGR